MGGGGGQNKADSVCELESILDSGKNAIALSKSAKDSRILHDGTNSTNAARRQDFGDKNGALQDESRACVTADSSQQSPFLAQKPTPEPSKAQSTNKAKTHPFHITHIEPYPALLHSLLKQSDIDSPLTRILPHRLQEIDICIFEELEANDILFIDSTHIAKINSDVNRIFFEILPRLKRGVYIHFHDIFYPFSYPNDWLRDKNSWNEAYVLRAFLSFNSAFEIVFFNTCLNHLYKNEFAAALPLSQKNTGGSLWLRKK